MQQSLDDLVGLDIVATMSPARRDHFFGQISGNVSRPMIPAGLAPFLRMPGPEPRTLTRARMALLISQLYPANGRVTDEDLVSAGFSRAEITDLFPEALRISGAAEMVI